MAKLLTPKEVANQLQVSAGTVYNWVNKKKIPYIKMNGSIRFEQGKIDNWIQHRSVRTKVGGMIV